MLLTSVIIGGKCILWSSQNYKVIVRVRFIYLFIDDTIVNSKDFVFFDVDNTIVIRYGDCC